MEGIEKLWWAKHRLEEQTEGKQRLIIGAGGHLFVKVDDSCLAACYFAMVRNQKTGQYHADVKGYLRTFGGYCNGTRLEQLVEEIGRLTALVKEMEAAELSVSEEELCRFCYELETQETAEGAEREA